MPPRLIPGVVTGKLDVREAATERPDVDPLANRSRGDATQAPSDSPILESICDCLSLSGPRLFANPPHVETGRETRGSGTPSNLERLQPAIAVGRNTG